MSEVDLVTLCLVVGGILVTALGYIKVSKCCCGEIQTRTPTGSAQNSFNHRFSTIFRNISPQQNQQNVGERPHSIGETHV